MRHIKRQLRLCGATSDSSRRSPWLRWWIVSYQSSTASPSHLGSFSCPRCSPASPPRPLVMIPITRRWEIWLPSSAVVTKITSPQKLTLGPPWPLRLTLITGSVWLQSEGHLRLTSQRHVALLRQIIETPRAAGQAPLISQPVFPWLHMTTCQSAQQLLYCQRNTFKPIKIFNSDTYMELSISDQAN